MEVKIQALTEQEVREIVRDETKKLMNLEFQPKQKDPVQPYMTKKELAVFARMSPGLVNRLANEGKFIRHRIGGRVLFDRSQVLEAIRSGSSVKYSRK